MENKIWDIIFKKKISFCAQKQWTFLEFWKILTHFLSNVFRDPAEQEKDDIVETQEVPMQPEVRNLFFLWKIDIEVRFFVNQDFSNFELISQELRIY